MILTGDSEMSISDFLFSGEGSKRYSALGQSNRGRISLI